MLDHLLPIGEGTPAKQPATSFQATRSTEREVPLTGGRLTAAVVRVGDTVRRPSKPGSAFVSRLLAHLELRGFDGAPRYFGRDDSGRDVLSFIPGVVPAKFRRFRDDQVRRAGQLLRAYHDATRGSRLAGECAVVCHHDPGPNNVVFQDDQPVAFIDYDMAEPGDELEDLGYMAWTWCLSSKPERGPFADQVRQVRLLVDGYRLPAHRRAQVMAATVERLTRNIVFWQEQMNVADPGMVDTIQGRIEWSRREFAFVESNRHEAVAAITA